MRTVASASPVDPMAGVWDMSRGRDRSAHGGWWATAAMAAAIVATMGAGIFGALVIQLLRPGPSPHPTALVVPDGTSVRGIAAILFDGGVLGEGVPFALGVRIVADNMPLQAGEFIFPARASALTAIGILASSTPVAHP
ncbi:MAG: hypothetical protein O7C63_08005, partial [Alphaproteobacteria bacterium]|nr:hypothetical protein [Alphaproteobacteria bacterium]